jgi:hypothetical protein
MGGDVIETCEHGTFQSLGRTRITQLTKRKAPELKGKIAPLWKNKSPTTQPDLVYDVVLQRDLPLKTGDGVTSLTRIGAGTAIRRCSFHACGRVLVKSPNSVVEACRGGPDLRHGFCPCGKQQADVTTCRKSTPAIPSFARALLSLERLPPSAL